MALGKQGTAPCKTSMVSDRVAEVMILGLPQVHKLGLVESKGLLPVKYLGLVIG